MAMGGKTAAEKRFDEIQRRMLQSKPVSRAKISAKIRSRRKPLRLANNPAAASWS
jgi:hypothetical protein